MIMAISAAILGATTFFVLAPILGWGRAAEEDEPALLAREELLEARRQVLASIKDLEMEHRVGKLTAEDFEATRESLSHEAVSILKKLDAAERDQTAAPGPEKQDGR